MYHIAQNIDENKVNRIKELEEKLGVVLLGLRSDNLEVAGLSEEDISLVKELEKEVGLTVVAFKK